MKQRRPKKAGQAGEQDRFYEALPGVRGDRSDYLDYEDGETTGGLTGWTVLGLVLLGLVIMLLWLSRGLDFKVSPPTGGSSITTETEL